MSQEQRTALVQAHRRARRQLATLQASRVSCRTVATELLSDDPSFRGCQPPLAPAASCMDTSEHAAHNYCAPLATKVQ